jgi:hypothetical protein
MSKVPPKTDTTSQGRKPHVKSILGGRRAALIAAAAMVPLALTTASAQAALASPAQASSTASATPADSCAGQTAYTATLKTPAHTATEHGFYFTNSSQVCVGQANLREDFNDSTGLAERVRVHSGGAGGPVIYETYNNSGSGAGTGTLDFTTHVSRLFNVNQVTVCVALVNQSDHSVVDNVVICKTLG